MNVVGIIAEYNPFHRGHEYQIRKLRELCHADYVVIAMSGNFVQRGAPALMDKYSRTQMALHCGADLVLELPALFATASAEYFARGGVALLNSTGIVTHLGFGAETDNGKLLTKLADILLEEPEPYQERLRQELKIGSSFPAARSAALLHYLDSAQSQDSSAAVKSAQSQDSSAAAKSAQLQDFTVSANFTTIQNACPAPAEIKDILAAPNNILALEYLQALAALHSDIIPAPIPRKGRGYHDRSLESETLVTESLNQEFCSASAIRSYLRERCTQLPKTSMPQIAYEILDNYAHPFLSEDDFSQLLHYELLTDDIEQLAAWGDSSLELAHRLLTERERFTSWSSFCQHIKTKNITYARLSRLFTHMLLHIRQEDYQRFPTPAYLRILGFRKAAAPLLTSLKKNSSLPIISNLADADHLLPTTAAKLLAMDLRASDLYRLCLNAKGDSTLKNDYRQQIIRL